jgi:hypothetical protein
MMQLENLPEVITAVGGLGTAAFGLVEAGKALFPINQIGFGGIAKAVHELLPGPQANSLAREKVLATLQANWFNGTDLSSQKAIAKSLIKLHLNPGNAAPLANVTGVDPAGLTQVATGIANGTSLTPQQNDLYARFDLIVTAVLDEAYQCSDQHYRNWTRCIASFVAVALAVVGGISLHTSLFESALVGLLATPLAPIAKDLSTALATAVNTLQAVKK